MRRRNALALATAISATGMSAALAVGANFGLFGLATAQNATIGNFKAVTADANGQTAQGAADDSFASTDETLAEAPPAPELEPEIVFEDEAPAPAAPAHGPAAQAANGASAKGLAQAASVTPPQANVPEQTPVGCSNAGASSCESRAGEDAEDTEDVEDAEHADEHAEEHVEDADDDD